MIGPLSIGIQDALGLNQLQFERLVERAPYSYKTYEIPKRTGGTRTIAQPAKETKLVQYWLIENIFSRLRIHQAATAYKSGASIQSNAAVHAANTYISKLDFKDFFPSISDSDLIDVLFQNLGEDLLQSDAAWIARVCCIRLRPSSSLCLSIGAPSSPVLSNALMHNFDARMHAWSSERGVAYTRYADDLTFSSNSMRMGARIEAEVKKQLQELHHSNILINTKKTTHLTKKHQRRVTGLVITNEGKLSLGRDRKRHISVLLHKFSLQQLSEDETYWLQGILGHAKNVEPSFVRSMSQKYGADLLRAIFAMRKPR